jgi:hypothetical protein
MLSLPCPAVPPRARLLPLAALVALLAGCQTANTGFSGDAQALSELSNQPLAGEPWTFGQHPGIAIKTPHYRIYTTIQDGLYQRLLARVVEGAWARATAANPQGHPAVPLDCYVFGTRGQWETYTRLRAGSNAPIYLQISAGGYCQEGVFAGYDIGREQTLSVIAHEAWHQYSWFTFKDRLPSWLEEGLATQNEAIDWQGVTPVFKPAENERRFSALRAALRENRLWKLPDLLTTHAGRVIKLPQRQIDAYYAQLWSLVLFLQNSPKYKPGLTRLLTDASNGRLTATLAGTNVTQSEIDNFTEHWNAVAGPIYLEKYINPDLAALESEYTAWLRQFTDSYAPKIPKAQ